MEQSELQRWGIRARPDVGGFTCKPTSSPKWIRTVKEVWIEYYRGGPVLRSRGCDDSGGCSGCGNVGNCGQNGVRLDGTGELGVGGGLGCSSTRGIGQGFAECDGALRAIDNYTGVTDPAVAVSGSCDDQVVECHDAVRSSTSGDVGRCFLEHDVGYVEGGIRSDVAFGKSGSPETERPVTPVTGLPGVSKRQKKNALKKKKKLVKGDVAESVGVETVVADVKGSLLDVQDGSVDLKKTDVIASASSVPEWRVRAGAISTDQVSEKKTGVNERRQGFFSGCDDVVQRDLRESRARLLILENKRKAIEQERKIAQLQSPMQLLQDAMKMMDFAGRVAKKQNDTKVQGWAKTVATSYAENIVKSVASPDSGSYESYVWSKASSDESRDSTPALTKGLANFNIELEQLKERYAGMPFYSQDDYDLDMMELKDKYAEALFEPLPAKLIRENNIKREQLFDIFKDEVLRLPHLELLERERADIFEEYGV